MQKATTTQLRATTRNRNNIMLLSIANKALILSAGNACLLLASPAHADSAIQFTLRSANEEGVLNSRLDQNSVLSFMTGAGVCRKYGTVAEGGIVTCGPSDFVFPTNAYIFKNSTHGMKFGEGTTSTGWPDSIRIDGGSAALSNWMELAANLTISFSTPTAAVRPQRCRDLAKLGVLCHSEKR